MPEGSGKSPGCNIDVDCWEYTALIDSNLIIIAGHIT